MDLFPIVRNGLLIGTPSYSIKKVERLYGEPCKEDVDSATDSIVQYAQWRKSGDQKILDNIRAYNEKDCQVTEGLHHFLLHLPQMRQIPFRDNKWETAVLDDNQDKQHTIYEKELEVAAWQWLQELPAQNSKQYAQSPHGLNRQLHQLIGQLIDFQEREGKVEWWEFFNRMQLTPEEREDDSEVIAGAHLQVVERSTKQSDDYCYRFDASQPLKLSAKGNTKLRFALLPLTQHGELPLSPLLNEKKKALD